MRPVLGIVVALLAASAWAQADAASAEDEFLPWAPAGQPPPTPPPAPAPNSAARVEKPQPPAQPLNAVSLYGAPTLGTLKRGVGVYLGFPLLGVKAGLGVTDRLDVGLGFDSFYGVMNEPRGFARLQWLDAEGWAASAVFEGGVAFFAHRPETEGARGARWLTGRRNVNAEAGVVFSYQGESPRSARLFLDLRYHLAFDTQPYSRDPLGGVPPALTLGHNLPVRMGAEMPFSTRASFLFLFGFDVHGRPGDSAFMPTLSVGLVTGI